MACLCFLPRASKIFSHSLSARQIFRCLSSTTFPVADSNWRGEIPTGEEARVRNKQLRVDLAAAYREFDRMNFNEAIDNHLSVMAPAADGSGKEVMLIHPFGLHWSEVL